MRDVEVTMFKNVKDTNPHIVSLTKILQTNWSKYVNEVRQYPYHSEEQRIAKSNVPCWIVTGITTGLNDEDLITPSGYMIIDIDKQDNPNIDMEQLKQQMMELTFVAAASLSISGEGIFLIIDVKDYDNIIRNYDRVVKLFKDKGVNIDSKCSNLCRKRFISYDPNILIKDKDTTPLFLLPPPTKPKQQTLNLFRPRTTNLNDELEFTRRAIWYALNQGYNLDHCNNSYNTWWHTGNEFKNFHDGQEMFIRLSQNSYKYHDDIQDIIKKYNQCQTATIADELHRKWRGIAKRYNQNWYKDERI